MNDDRMTATEVVPEPLRSQVRAAMQGADPTSAPNPGGSYDYPNIPPSGPPSGPPNGAQGGVAHGAQGGVAPGNYAIGASSVPVPGVNFQEMRKVMRECLPLVPRFMRVRILTVLGEQP